MRLNYIDHGDCLEGMKEIPDQSVDLIVTDPPYGISYASAWIKDKSRRGGGRMDAIKKNTGALYQLNTCRRVLTTQQYKTLRGQILAGDAEGALRGLEKIMESRRRRHDNTTRQGPGHCNRQQPKD